MTLSFVSADVKVRCFLVDHTVFEKRIIISPFAYAYQCTNFISIVFALNFVSSCI